MRYPAGDTGQQNRQWVHSLIQHGELYFPVASELNDPFEAAPRFRIPQSLDELLSSYESWANQRSLSPQEIAAQKDVLAESFASGTYTISAELALAKYPDIFRNRVPLCSFAATRQNTLMWSYYADGHKGVCVHFHAREPSPFSTAHRVVYQHEYPIVQVPVGLGSNLMTVALLTKSSAWDHEKEYRLINLPRDGVGRWDSPRIYDDLFLWKTPQLAVTQLHHISGITVGASMDGSEIEEILRACYERTPRITYVEQAVPKRDVFELEFRRIN